MSQDLKLSVTIRLTKAGKKRKTAGKEGTGMKHLIDINDLSERELEELIDKACDIIRNPAKLFGKV